MPKYALVDCNNFYCSCERIFNPSLIGRPIVALSNNDGCVISRSAEAKALGIKMGEPFFKLRDIIAKHNVAVVSSNYTLYGDMSQRAMSVIEQFSPNTEVYSIDEVFVDCGNYAELDLPEYSQQIRQRVLQWTGLPVCVGVGATKTLAKLANHRAKKNAALNGVCVLPEPTHQEMDSVLASSALDDIWGIGRRLAPRLQKLGINTPLELRNAPSAWIRDHFGVTVQRTALELGGIACFELDMSPAPNKQIVVSRSFGERLTEFFDIRSAIIAFAESTAEKLRKQHHVTDCLQVFAHTSPFSPNDPQYSGAVTVRLAAASSDTRTIVAAACLGLERIYRRGFRYSKAGVMLMNLRPPGQEQLNLLAHSNSNTALMTVMDKINSQMGRQTLTSAGALYRSAWSMKQTNLSPRYTTRWSDLPVVRA